MDSAFSIQKYIQIVKKLATVRNGAILVAVLLLGWYFFGPKAATLGLSEVVQPKTFLQQVSIAGTVISANSSDLGFSQSGRVTHVYVSVGQRVGAGQILAEIENGDLRATLLQRQAALDSQKAKLISLQNGTRPEDVAVSQSQVDADTSSVSQANQAIVNAIQDSYSKSDDAVHNVIDQFLSNPRTQSVQYPYAVSDSQVTTQFISDRLAIESILSDWQNAVSALQGTADSSAVSAGTSAQARLQKVITILSEASAVLARTISSQSVSQATLSGWTNAVAVSRTSASASLTALTSALTAQKSAVAQLARDQKSLELKKAPPTQSDIDAQAANVKSAEADVANVNAQLQKSLIVAPFTGTITKMDLHAGEVASPGTSEITIMSNGRYQIETYISELNIADIQIGQMATVTLDAYGKDTEFGAKVILIDPARTIKDGVTTYKTTLEFTANDDRIRSGMTANTIITTARKENVIAIPVSALVTRGDSNFVDLVVKDKSVETSVETGGHSLGEIEITKGLSAGDTILLSPKK